MIKIKDINDESCDLYDPNHGYLGRIDNMLQFADIRVQIREKKANGYYIKFQGRRIEIDYKGNLSDWPKGLFDKLNDLLFKLI